MIYLFTLFCIEFYLFTLFCIEFYLFTLFCIEFGAGDSEEDTADQINHEGTGTKEISNR